MNARECVYVGKVKTDGDIGLDPLARRHDQHRREGWYIEIGDENLLLQYIHVPTHADADILETYFISIYEGTGQLRNKAKTGWGKATVSVWKPTIAWNNYLTRPHLQETWLEDRFLSMARVIKVDSVDFWQRRQKDVEQFIINEIRDIFATVRKGKRAELEFEQDYDELFLRNESKTGTQSKNPQLCP
jgi:predicted acetyltransferase